MSDAQAASAVLMIEPRQFGANPETRESNRFQSRAQAPADAAVRAQREFVALAEALERHGVRVLRFEGSAAQGLPDEVFPNNWLSLHADGTAVLYPMLAPNRRAERRRDVLDALGGPLGLRIDRVVDLTAFERVGDYLEGTGSLVLDRVRRIAYGCRSPRTHPVPAAEFGRRLGHELVLFDAFDARGVAPYHTNVLLTLGTRFALVCASAIRSRTQRRAVLTSLTAGGRELIEFTLEQLEDFVGNMLELATPAGPLIVMSRRAAAALNAGQRAALERHGQLLSVAVDTIETIGGGSVRCMLAEVPLPARDSAPHSLSAATTRA